MRLFLIVAASLLALSAFADTPAFRVIATADSTDVHPESAFDVTLSLVNVTNIVQKITYPGGAWDRLCRSSNRHVSWDTWAADEDGLTVIQIAPHQTYLFPNSLQMFVDDSVKQARIDFRMGIKTAAFGKTVWSAPITLNVTP